jgi:hypothetical protein
MRRAIAAAVASMALQAQTAPTGMLKDVRIALRLDSGKVFIIGGSLAAKKRDESIFDQSANLKPLQPGHARLQPFEEFFLARPGDLSRLEITPETSRHAGDRWQIYTGAGPELTVVVESIALSGYCGGLGGYAAALAHFVNPGTANVVAGLRAEEYLAAPFGILKGVSEHPLETAELSDSFGISAKLDDVLLRRARSEVKTDDWQPLGPQARQLNHTLLNSTSLQCEKHYQYWRVSSTEILALVEAGWRDEIGSAVFGANAVVNVKSPSTILAFDTNPGVLMRAGEVADDLATWKREEPGAFLNAWTIGTRRLILMYQRGYEGSRVELKELVPGQGFVPTGIEFGGGC